MICLKDAIRLIKNPAALPCEPCVLESLRNPLASALASIDREAAKESPDEDALQRAPIWNKPNRAALIRSRRIERNRRNDLKTRAYLRTKA